MIVKQSVSNNKLFYINYGYVHAAYNILNGLMRFGMYLFVKIMGAQQKIYSCN